MADPAINKNIKIEDWFHENPEDYNFIVFFKSFFFVGQYSKRYLCSNPLQYPFGIL